MSLVQFFRILVARRWMILTSLAASLVGALLIITIFPPRYVATSRMMLDILKPDPVTGLVMGSQTVRAYTQTQSELIKDYDVAGRVVDALGWTNDPGLVDRFGGDPATARHRLAALIIDRTEAQVLAQSNILEIKYTGTSAEQARTIADAIRHAYVDVTLAFKQNSARGSAQWFDTEAEKARRQLAIAEQTKSSFERATGLVMNPDKTDLDSSRLQALSGQAQVPPTIAPAPTPIASPSAAEAARVDSQITLLRRTLGENNPQIRALEQQKTVLLAQAAQERAAAGAANSAAARAAQENSVAVQRALQSQKAKVLASRSDLTKLQQLQDDVDVLRDRYNKAIARAAELRMQGNVADSGITPLGNAVSPENPTFPNIPLILSAAVGFGLLLGVFSALLVELLNRRVRLSRDLEDAVHGVPLLAVIGVEHGGRGKTRTFGRVWRPWLWFAPKADEAVPA